MKTILVVVLVSLAMSSPIFSADLKPVKKEPSDPKLKELSKGLKSEYDKFSKTTTFTLPNSVSSRQKRLCVELALPDTGRARLFIKGWVTVQRPNPPILAQKILAMVGEDVFEITCTDKNYRYVQGRNSGFNATLLALNGDNWTPPDVEEIRAEEENKEVLAVILKISESTKGQKIDVRFSGQQNKVDFKMEERDRALFSQMILLKDYLNSKKDEPAK